MKVKYSLTIGISNCKREAEFDMPKDLGIDESEWNTYTEEDKIEAIEDDWSRWSSNFIDGSWEYLEEENG